MSSNDPQLFMETENTLTENALTEEICIWCTLCRKQARLDEALLGCWSYCKACSHFTCDQCGKDVENHCHSDLCREANRSPKLGPIPTEKIVLFAKNEDPIQMSMDQESLIYKLFYEEEHIKNTGYEVQKKKEADIKTSEEVWRSQGIVITRRRKGKFISWGKVF